MSNDGASSGDDRGSRERSPSVSAVPVSIPSRAEMFPHHDRPELVPGVPFAHFQWNYGWGSWEQVVPEAAGQPGVVAAYPHPDLQCEPMTAEDEEGWSEWIHPLPGYLMQCCDCGLIHEMQVAIGTAEGDGALNDGETREALVLFRMRRHERPSGQPPCPPCEDCGAEMVQTSHDTWECGKACPASSGSDT